METNNQTEIRNIRLFLICPSPMNPRKSFDMEALRELADNIKKQGLLQPITVRTAEYSTKINRDGITSDVPYEIVCGERRYRACSMLQMETIPCIVREMSDDEALDAMITENLQRRDVDPVEEAEAFRLLQERGASVEELSLRFGKSQSYVSNRIRLNSLIPELKKALSGGLIPIGGAYLLARLTEDDQKDFHEEYTKDCEEPYSVTDISGWINELFMNLWNAPFQNGEDLSEAWNPKGELIRRCKECDCNTANHGCLFADMKTKEPQCTDSVCYERKKLIFYDWVIRKEDGRIVLAGTEPCTGKVAIVCDDSRVYGESERKLLADLRQKCEDKGYRIFSEKELPNRIYGVADIKNKMEAGVAIKCICLHRLANFYRGGIEEYYLLPHPEETARVNLASGTSTDTGYLRSRLCERKADIERKTDTKITNFARKNFDEGSYIGRTGGLEDWEKTVVWAIIYEQVDFMQRDRLIEGTKYHRPGFREMKEFRDRMDNIGVNPLGWMRRAIARFIKSASNDTYLVEAISRQSVEAQAFIQKAREDAGMRIDAIDEELREMGYDENGNKL